MKTDLNAKEFKLLECSSYQDSNLYYNYLPDVYKAQSVQHF